MASRAVDVSKLLSLVLRHNPSLIGLTLDHGGWALIDDIVQLTSEFGYGISREEIEYIVATSDKQRFSLTPDHRRIRANQGHSIPVDLDLEPAVPPERLYHGTAVQSVPEIVAHGILAMSRQHVHLSPDPGTAKRVGARHGSPAVLVVESGRMHRSGLSFFTSANGVWLTEFVPASYAALLTSDEA